MNNSFNSYQKRYTSHLYSISKINKIYSTYTIYNECDKIVYICNDMNFEDFLKVNNLPYQLKLSYLNNGKPIYVSYDGASETSAIKNNYTKYIGWYCLKDNNKRFNLYNNPFLYLMCLEFINKLGRENREVKMNIPENKELRIMKMKSSLNNISQEDKKKIINKKKNFAMCKIINTNSIVRVSKEEFDKRDDLVGVSKGNIGNYTKIHIFNNNNELMYITNKGFDRFCNENNIPKEFNTSYRNNGKPIYLNIDKGTEKRLNENGNIKYRGWYALKVED